jgi:hypothetical protein
MQTSDVSKAYLNGDVMLPDSLLLKYYIYIKSPAPTTVIDSASRRIRLQVWRPYDEVKAQWQLVWEQIVSVYPTKLDAVYVVS